jgi:amino acid adenylation domain-containing protein
MAPGNPVYNVPTCFRIRGRLDIGALERCLNQIVRRHEILRTTFERRDGEPVQVIADNLHIRAVVIDSSGDAFRKHAVDEARRPFNLAQGPLMRVVLFRLADEDHAVLIAMHHIVCDGWSMGVLFRELATLYASAVRHAPEYLSDLPVQYADYAVWQRERVQSGKLAQQIEYWRQHLRGVPTVFELPADRIRPAVPTFRGSVLHTTIDSPLSEALIGIAQTESTTPFVLLLAAYAVLLHRYTRQNDSIIGCPVSNRNRSELEPLIGFLPNTLPLRVDTSGDPSFLDLLRSLRTTTAQAFANAEAPFEAITDAVAFARSGQKSLFQVAFMMQEQPPARRTFGDIEIEPIDLDAGTAKCDLTLVGVSGPAGISLAYEYSTDLFIRESIERMSDHFRTLLEAIASHPAARVSELALMSPREEHQILAGFSQTFATIEDPRGLHELFEEHAALQPDAPALVFGSCVVTYAALNRRANQIAHALRLHGTCGDALVAIALRRSPDLIAAVLGVLKTGAAFLPLALDHPAERIAFQIEDAKPVMLVTTGEDRQGLPDAVQKMAWLDFSRLDASHAAETNPDRTASSSGLAYVIYTSGSTGKPKGAMLEHRGLTNLAIAQQALFELGPGCRVLQFAPPAFDASVWEIAMALGSGACLCLGSGASFVPDELARVMREQRVTTVTLPPSILRNLTPADFPELRTVVSAGESCPEALARDWSHGRSFFNAYGPTEVTVCATAARWQPLSQKLSIGRPLQNVRTYILDAHMRPVPAGVPGELHIGGVGVARGYLNRPELSSERFVADPFDSRGGRLYKTGDLARYLSNGEIEFLGRIDGQLKLRGHRIEPGEIEARLESHPAVRECAVILRDERLIAFFIPRGPGPGGEDLRAFAALTLPQYMVPSTFVALPELPVNSSGKIDRRALAQMELPGQSAHTAARDDLENTIAGIWAEVLRVPSVGVTDNFFELGGNSLMAVNLMARISARTGSDLPVTALFHAGTVEQIARIIVQSGREHRERGNPASVVRGSLVNLQPRGSKPPLLLIPPAGGSLICYSELARLLGPDQPVFGIEAPRGVKPAKTVEEIAARYVRELHSASFEPPFHIAGWSFGGNVAFEMARQLAERGRPASLVVLLDSFVTHKGKVPAEMDILLEIARVQALARGVGLNVSHDAIRRLKGRDRAMAIAAQMERDPKVSPETIATELRTIHQEFRSHMRAARRYVPGCYGGRVAVLRAADSRWSGDHGWSRLCADLELYEVPGAHRTLLAQPHVAALAGILRNALRSSVTPSADEEKVLYGAGS